MSLLPQFNTRRHHHLHQQRPYHIQRHHHRKGIFNFFFFPLKSIVRPYKTPSKAAQCDADPVWETLCQNAFYLNNQFLCSESKQRSTNQLNPTNRYLTFNQAISGFLERILMEHIELICSLEPKLTFIPICSIRIRSRIWNIAEKTSK